MKPITITLSEQDIKRLEFIRELTGEELTVDDYQSYVSKAILYYSLALKHQLQKEDK